MMSGTPTPIMAIRPPSLNPQSSSITRLLIYFTGDFWQPNGSFGVSTPLTRLDMDRLTEYTNHGGIVIAMGQDLASVWYANTHYTPSNDSICLSRTRMCSVATGCRTA